MSSSDVILWNPGDNDLLLGSKNGMDTLKVLCVDTLKFTSNHFAEYTDFSANFPPFPPISAPTVANTVTIDTKAIAIDDTANFTVNNPVTIDVKTVFIDYDLTVADKDQV